MSGPLRIPRLALALAFAGLLAAGCSSGRDTGRVNVDPGTVSRDTAQVRGEESVRIEVTNDITPPTSVVVYVETPTGARTRLGRVQPGRTETFRYSPRSQTRRIRLLARTNRDRVIRSDEFRLARTGGIRWNVH
jgi:hypothetical protein